MKRRILFISAFTPSLYSAGQAFTQNLLLDLSSDFEIDLVYFKYNDQTYRPPNSSVSLVKEIKIAPFQKLLNAIFCPIFHPIFSVRFSWVTAWSLQQLSRKKDYDFVYFDFSQVFVYSLFFKQRKVLMLHDVMYQKYTRAGYPLERLWIKFNESFLVHQQDTHLITFSSKDQHLIRTKYEVNASVSRFYITASSGDKNESIHGHDYFCFYAAWNRPENYEGLLWFLENVAPIVSIYRFMVVGAGMPSTILAQLSKFKNFEYTGFVDDPYVLIRSAQALIAPIFKGAGVKVKVIESLACGTPVIGSSMAFEGIDPLPRHAVEECHTPYDFISSIRKFADVRLDKTALRDEFIFMYVKNGRPSVKEILLSIQ